MSGFRKPAAMAVAAEADMMIVELAHPDGRVDELDRRRSKEYERGASCRMWLSRKGAVQQGRVAESLVGAARSALITPAPDLVTPSLDLCYRTPGCWGCVCECLCRVYVCDLRVMFFSVCRFLVNTAIHWG